MKNSALASTGEVWSWGSGLALGHGRNDESQQLVPRVIGGLGANASVRWYNNESRQQTMIQLNKIIRKAFEFMRGDELIAQNLDSSIKGLIELRKTYIKAKQNAQNAQNSKLISFPKAIKNDCIDGKETGLKMYSYGPDSAWSHNCKFTDIKSLIGSGTIATDSGSINLSEKGEITMSGSYSGLNSIQEKELKKGGFSQIFAGGYGSYAAMREDGSMVVLGMNSQDDTETINTLIKPPSEIKDIQFSYGGGAVKLKDGQILTWGNEGAYADELRYRINR